MIEQALEEAVKQAIENGNRAAKEELEKLMDATEGSETASKLWGKLGANAIRGEVPTTKQSKDWYKWVRNFVGRRLSERRSREQYNRKVPFDPRISPKGRTRKKLGVVGIDVSGSMPQEWIDKFINRLGKSDPELELIAVAWDGKAELLNLGGEVHGGGGTQIECFDDWMTENLRNDPDFILVVTDGYFSKFTPAYDARLYGFLIIPGGTTWMKDAYISSSGVPCPRMMTTELENFDLA